MYRVEVHRRMEQAITLFHYIGLWHDDNDPTKNKYLNWAKTLWHLIVYGYYPLSLALGALNCDSDTEAIFLAVLAIVATLLTMRLFYFALGKKKIVNFIRTLAVHKIKDSEKEFHRVDNTVDLFGRFATYFEAMLVVAVTTMIAIAMPFLSSEKHFPLNIYVPLDWRNNEFYYWLIYVLVSYDLLMTIIFSCFNVIIWYLVMSIVLEYEILGNEFQNLGKGNNYKAASRSDTFEKELLSLIKQHKNLQRETVGFNSYFSSLFFIQIATSGLAICGSVFALAFVSATFYLNENCPMTNVPIFTMMMFYESQILNDAENPAQYGVYVISLLYNFFDIFMITYFGNEIILSSGRLSYCLFQSNWMDQSESTKKTILILMEVYKRPEQIVVGKLYPLDVEIFTNILNFAYRMFNILKSM